MNDYEYMNTILDMTLEAMKPNRTKTVKEACEKWGLERGVAVNADARCQQLEALCKKLAEACHYSYLLIEKGIGQATHAVALLEIALAETKELEVKP